jgi:D-glycero-D-manno-heptose 1,7-bisphosphate phosphatase
MSTRKIIFIDRDGVINKDPGGWTEFNYVTSWKQFIFIPRALAALKKLRRAGYHIIVMSNQAGISKGYYSLRKLEEINRKMLAEIKKSCAALDRVYYCVHQNSDNCGCRKPKTGLFKQAQKDLGIKAKGKFFVGDGRMDVEAGKKMKMKTILVLSGKSPLNGIEKWKTKPDYIFNDLWEAAEFILK